MKKMLFVGIDKIFKPIKIKFLNENYQYNSLIGNPKYAIGYCGKNGYSLVKNTLFGYKYVKMYSFGGAPIIAFYDNLNEARETLRAYVLDKYCGDISGW
jgi:hypothetical protein